jgi:CRISPR-associated protein Cmr6
VSRLQGIRREAGLTHAGLWFDRGLDTEGGDDAKRRLVADTASLGCPVDSYQAFFERWSRYLEALRRADGSGKTIALKLETKDRLAVGHGAESVIETSIALHRAYGVPCIPGSALKGVAARRADAIGDQWKRGGTAFELLFGHAGDEVGECGVVTFHDALPVPGTWKLLPDTITVHHRRYYPNGAESPTDWDDPNPVPLLTCTGTFRLFLTGPPNGWLDRATQLLADALELDGVGAKTALGYGRLRIEGHPARKGATPGGTTARAVDPPRDPLGDFRKRVEGRLRSLAAGNAADEVPRLLAECPAEGQIDLARAIEAKLRRKWLEARRGTPWAAELLRLLGGGA